MPPPDGRFSALRAAALLAALGLGAVLPGGDDRTSGTLIFLPGTQPGTTDSVALAASSCSPCHSSSGGREVPVYRDWAGGMMAHSARDPVFYAALAITNKYAASVGDNTGEYCIRCHSPSGWLAGRSEDVSGRSLRGTDLDGVQCDHCHRIVDPLRPDSSAPGSIFPVPGYGNGMHVVQASGDVKRGPREPSDALHPAVRDTFQGSGSLCGICHDVSNPFLTEGDDRIVQPPHAYAPLERTYSEWLLSDFSSEGAAGSCQGCHMRAVQGYAASTGAAPARPDVRSHDFTGGNDFVPRLLAEFWAGLDTSALEAASLRARATLRRAAALSAEAGRSGDSLALTVRITNLTGHKLPTGYPEGRRMWLTVVATDSLGDTVFASGLYDTATATLAGDPPARVYEAVHGLSDSTAGVHGLAPGPSFHFSLNDTILSDNRIPPRGFTNGAFAARLAAPVAATYADGSNFDESVYLLPGRAAAVGVSLWYQSISREYVEFLRDENEGNVFDWNGWGARLYDAWERHGRSAPVRMASLSVNLADTVTSAPPGAHVTEEFRLAPPYPNPFNGIVRIPYSLPRASEMRLDVIDLRGRVVAVLASGRRSAGGGTVAFSPTGLAGGVYLVRMTAEGFSSSRKILFIR